jgi:spermidine synthase
MRLCSNVYDRSVGGERGRGRLLVGIGLVSFASLLLEVALTRLFSVALFYHFAFLGISLALLGLGAGGVFAYLWRDWLARWELRQLASVTCILNSAAVMAALEIVLHVPVSLSLGPLNFLRLTAIYAAAGVPFLFTGILFSLVFERQSKWVTQLYGADLVGGATACLAAVPLLNILGGPNTIVCAGLAMAMAAVIWESTGRERKIAAGIAVLLVGLVAANHSQRLIDIVYAKGTRNAHPGVEFARWNAISRVEVDDFGVDRGKQILIDADAATNIMNTDPEDPKSFMGGPRSPESPAIPDIGIANVLRPRGDYAIIGPGGGIDVLRAVIGGSSNVTAIEINSIIVNTVMRGRYADYTHHLYELPQVHIHVNDGRSWIRSSQHKYDVLQMNAVDTWASTSAGAFSLSENNLYTVEAFREYFDHLRPDGFIAITRWEFARPREALRVVSTAIEVLRRMGFEDVRKYFMVVLDKDPKNGGGTRVTVLARKSPFTVEEERTLLQYLSANPNLYPLYTPYIYGRPEENVVCAASTPTGACVEMSLARLAEQRRAPPGTIMPYDRLINLPWRGEAGGKEFSPRAEFIHSYPYNIAPVTDDAPFFFFTFKGTGALHALRTRLAHKDVVELDGLKNNLGVEILGMLLIISIAAVLSFLVGPLALHSTARKQHVLPLLYFVAIGLGYILVEVALIQRFVLFLGHPTYALTVVLFLMLFSSGVGSVVSRRWLSETWRVRRVLAAIIGMVVLYVVVLHAVLGFLVGLPFWTKLLVSGVLLAPLGFLMGMPFPTGLRVIASKGSALGLAPLEHFSEPVADNSLIEWAWAMNAASSVLGSVLAMVLAIHFGFNAALAFAAGAYVTATALIWFWHRTPIHLAANVGLLRDAGHTL